MAEAGVEFREKLLALLEIVKVAVFPMHKTEALDAIDKAGKGLIIIVTEAVFVQPFNAVPVTK